MPADADGDPDPDLAKVSTADSGGEHHHGLRGLSLTGGVYLMGREGTGIVIRLGGVLLVTRAIGPYNYGIYASAAAFVTLLAAVAQLGVEVGLIGGAEQPTERAYNTAFTLLLVNSAVAVGFGLVGAWVIASVSHAPPYLPAFLVLLISIPLNICWAPAQARIERQFRYRRMAMVELGGDVALYGTAVPLALLGCGYWAPIIGFIVWQGFLFVGSLVAAGVVPRLAWDRAEVRRMLHFGSGYGLTICIMSMTGLVNPIVVGHFVGPAGVGYVAIGQRLTATLSFANRAVGRLSLVALGRVQNDVARLKRGVEQAMALQVIVNGVMLSGFAVVSSFAIPALLGPKWHSVVHLYPFLALGDLLTMGFLVPQQVLYTKGRNGAVLIKQVGNLLVLALMALWLVPRWGITGYGLAYVASVLPLVVVLVAARRIVPIRFGRTTYWLAAFSPPLFFVFPPWPWRLLLLVPLGLVGVVPRMRRDLVDYTRMVWNALRRRTGGTGEGTAATA